MSQMNRKAPVLVYSHIEKSAGTSMRLLLWDNYGRENVFWYGIDTPAGQPLNPAKLGKYAAIGGHFDFSEFDSVEYPTLRTAVVREPVARAASLFHYHAVVEIEELRKIWLQHGFDPSSMKNTLADCPRFVNAISNAQCRRLSGERNYSAVKNKLSGMDCVLGAIDDLPDYTRYLGAHLGWRCVDMPSVNQGDKAVEEQLRRDKAVVGMIEGLNIEDTKLYEFINHHGIYGTVGHHQSTY